jgi:hypothetical protein
MEANFGGPVWHASIRLYDEMSSPIARAMAYRELAGVGDADLGQWEGRGHTAFHLRRRLSKAEQEQLGLSIRDVRGTEEGLSRARKITAVNPLVAAMAAEELA